LCIAISQYQTTPFALANNRIAYKTIKIGLGEVLNGGFLRLRIPHSASHVGRLSLAISADFAPYDFISVLGDIRLFRAYQATPEKKSQQIIPAGKVSLVDW
jgi:hypothetical protein